MTELDVFTLDTMLVDFLEKLKNTHRLEYIYLKNMYLTGLRVSECCEMDSIVVLDDNKLQFPEKKRSNARVLDVSELEPLYFELFQSEEKAYKYMYPKRLSQLMRKLFTCDNIKIGEKNVSTHLFRHNYIKKLLLIDGNTVEVVRDIVQHKSVTSTIAYANSKIIKY